MQIPTLPEESLRGLHVGVLYLFGSQVTGTTTPMSDIDVGVVFTSPEPLVESADTYTRLYDVLTDVLPGPARVDVVFLQRTPPAFQFNAIRTGEVLFEADPVFRADYEERVVNEYLDFEPVLREFSAALLAR
jgi:predicted nucleotidyltransferase